MPTRTRAQARMRTRRTAGLEIVPLTPARWPDLEGVAFVVTLDAAAARQVTTEAFATLHQRWREALDADLQARLHLAFLPWLLGFGYGGAELREPVLAALPGA